jgi:hypothetical protein
MWAALATMHTHPVITDTDDGGGGHDIKRRLPTAMAKVFRDALFLATHYFSSLFTGFNTMP